MSEQIPRFESFDFEERWPLALGVVVGVALGLRVAGIGAVGLWGDEATTLWFLSRHGPGELLTVIPRMQPHPPLYYVVLDLVVDVVGLRPEVLVGRLLSIVFGVATVVATGLLGREAWDRRVGLSAAAVAATSPILLWASQDLRPYALLSALGATAVWLSLRALRTRRSRAWWAAAVSTAALTWTHVYGVFLAAGIVVLVAVGILEDEGDQEWRWPAAGFLVATAPIALWLVAKVVLPQPVAGTENQASHTAHFWRYLRETPNQLIVRKTDNIWDVWTTELTVLSILATALFARGEQSTHSVALVAGVGIVGPILASAVHPIYQARYLVGAIPLLLVLAARGAVVVGDRSPPIGALLLAGLLIVSTAAATPSAGMGRPDWDGVADDLDDQVDGDDIVIVEACHAHPAINYRLDHPVQTEVPHPTQADVWIVTGSTIERNDGPCTRKSERARSRLVGTHHRAGNQSLGPVTVTHWTDETEDDP